MTEDKAIDVNIAILPSEEVTEKAIHICNTISSSHKTNIRLSHDLAIPHINMHQTAFPERNLEVVEDIVGGIAKEISEKIKIELNGYSLFCGNGIFWDVVVTEELIDLHMKIIERTNPWREGLIMEQHGPFMSNLSLPIDHAHRDMLSEYGNPLAGVGKKDKNGKRRNKGTFRPHLTITSVKDAANADNALKITPITPCSFEADEIHIMDVGENGTCPRDGRNIILPFLTA